MFAVAVSGVDFSNSKRPFDPILLIRSKKNTVGV